jgi:hypothetical protein
MSERDLLVETFEPVRGSAPGGSGFSRSLPDPG